MKYLLLIATACASLFFTGCHEVAVVSHGHSGYARTGYYNSRPAYYGRSGYYGRPGYYTTTRTPYYGRSYYGNTYRSGYYGNRSYYGSGYRTPGATVVVRR